MRTAWRPLLRRRPPIDRSGMLCACSHRSLASVAMMGREDGAPPSAHSIRRASLAPAFHPSCPIALSQPHRSALHSFGVPTTAHRHAHTKPRGNHRPTRGPPPPSTKPRRPPPKRPQQPYRSPQFSKCQTLEEALDLAADHLDRHTPRDLAAFWTVLPRFLSQMERTPKRHAKQMRRMYDKCEVISKRTLENIDKYKPREISTVALGYAKVVAEVGNPTRPLPRGSPHEIVHTLLVGADGARKRGIFTHIAQSSLRTLPEFVAQDLSNFIYAYGIIDYVPELDEGNFLDTVANEAIWALDNFDDVQPQALSNISWAYSTLDQGRRRHSPPLFEKMGDHIVGLDNLDEFRPQALANVAWAYANAAVSHPKLFDMMAGHIAGLEGLEDFIPQHLANIAWAYATNGRVDERLFLALAPAIQANLGRFRCQELANIAWAYAVADVAAPSLFDEEFVGAVLAREGDFHETHGRQLHQWHLWREERGSGMGLPPSLRNKCKAVFVAAESSSSALEDDVIAELKAIGLDPEREVLTESGYRLDAMVVVKDKRIGIEVDGPSHFVGAERGREPNGGTILKRRQVAALDGIPVVAVPHWEWKKRYGTESERMRQHLRDLLGLTGSGDAQDPDHDESSKSSQSS